MSHIILSLQECPVQYLQQFYVRCRPVRDDVLLFFLYVIMPLAIRPNTNKYFQGESSFVIIPGVNKYRLQTANAPHVGNSVTVDGGCWLSFSLRALTLSTVAIFTKLENNNIN